MPFVRNSTEHGVAAAESVGPGGWLVAFGGGAGEEDIVEIWVVYMQLMGADSDYRAVCEQFRMNALHEGRRSDGLYSSCNCCIL